MSTESLLPPAPAPNTAAPPPETATDQDVRPNLTVNRAHTGKVARLPKATREKLNRMLEENTPARVIIEALGTDGAGLSEQNISNWRQGGYQEWLRDQYRIQAERLKQEYATGLNGPDPAIKITQAATRVAATHLCELISDFDTRGLHEGLESRPETYARLLHAAARLGETQIHFEEHEQRQAEAQAKLAKEKDPAQKRAVTESSLRLAEDKLRKM